LYMEDRSKNKYIHKNKHNDIQTYAQPLQKWNCLYGNWVCGERKREYQSIKNIIKHNNCEGRRYKDEY
jgi:hypothetical protein